MFCADCGKELKAGRKFCIYCGEPIPEEIQKLMEAEKKQEENKADEVKDAHEIHEDIESANELKPDVSVGSNSTEKNEGAPEHDNSLVDEDPNRTVLISVDRGEDTLILSEADHPEIADDSMEIEDSQESPEEPNVEEDDGETELVEQDPEKIDAGGSEAGKSVVDTAASADVGRINRKPDKELKYLNNVINESDPKGASVAANEEKHGGTSLLIKVLAIILVVLILIAAGLAAYFYFDSAKMREKYAYEEETSGNAATGYINCRLS